jgi:hypothetical protein
MYRVDLSTNWVVVTDVIKYVTKKQERIDTLHKLDERIETFEEKATTNRVF